MNLDIYIILISFLYLNIYYSKLSILDIKLFCIWSLTFNNLNSSIYLLEINQITNYIIPYNHLIKHPSILMNNLTNNINNTVNNNINLSTSNINIIVNNISLIENRVNQLENHIINKINNNGLNDNQQQLYNDNMRTLLVQRLSDKLNTRIAFNDIIESNRNNLTKIFVLSKLISKINNNDLIDISSRNTYKNNLLDTIKY